MKISNCKITRDEDGIWIVTVNGNIISKQTNVVQASKKLHRYLKSQS